MNTDAVCKFVTICLPPGRIYTVYSNGKQKTAYFTKLQLCMEDLYGCFLSVKHVGLEYFTLALQMELVYFYFKVILHFFHKPNKI